MEVTVLTVCETRAKVKEDSMTQVLDERSESSPSGQLQRAYVGVGVVKNPLLCYVTIEKYSEATIQTITVKVTSLKISGPYISPRTLSEDGKTARDGLRRISGPEAKIMRGMNVRYTTRGTRCNPGGCGLILWAHQNGWTIIGPEKFSFSSPRGSSSPKNFMTRGLLQSYITPRSDLLANEGDHLLVELKIELHQADKQEVRQEPITRKQQRSLQILEKARERYN